MSHVAGANVQTHFGRMAARYTALRSGGVLGLLQRIELRAVQDLAAVEPGMRVLDAGCGDGRTLDWLHERRARAVGIDLTQEMARLAHAAGHLACVQDMEELGLRPRFDRVLCVGSLEFTRDPASALAGFAHCLRAGGRLVLLFPERRGLGRLYRYYHRRHGIHIHLFDRAEIRRLLAPWFHPPSAWRFCGLSSVCAAQVRGREARVRGVEETEVRRQKAEGRRQKTEDRRQKTEDRRQKAEDRRQETEGGRQKAEDRRQNEGPAIR